MEDQYPEKFQIIPISGYPVETIATIYETMMMFGEDPNTFYTACYNAQPIGASDWPPTGNCRLGSPILKGMQFKNVYYTTKYTWNPFDVLMSRRITHYSFLERYEEEADAHRDEEIEALPQVAYLFKQTYDKIIEVEKIITPTRME